MNEVNISIQENVEQRSALSECVGSLTSKVYYADDRCTIYHGDCTEILPCLAPVDFVITDPPFNADYGFENDNMPDNEFFKFTQKWVRKAESKSKYGMTIIVDPKYCLPFYKSVTIQYHHTYTWFKKNAMRAMQGGFANKTEVIVYTNRKPARVAAYPNDVWEIPLVPQDVPHPTPKPVKLMELIISKFTKIDETVLDPFCGSGATLLACKELGRKAIGIEMEERYCEIAANRLRQNVLF
jgi:site-specific DNA-methyltransferase (adenine-specific)